MFYCYGLAALALLAEAAIAIYAFLAHRAAGTHDSGLMIRRQQAPRTQ